MTVRKDWLERVALVVTGWAVGIVTGLGIAKWLF